MEAKEVKRRKRERTKTMLVGTRYGAHLCEFIPDPGGKGYTVVAKHVPGAVTQGKTLREAERMAREALELCIECLAMTSSSRRVTRRAVRRIAVAAKA